MNYLRSSEFEIFTFFEMTPGLVRIAGKDGYFRKVNRDPGLNETLKLLCRAFTALNGIPYVYESETRFPSTIAVYDTYI